MQFTDDEIEIIKSLIEDYGSYDPNADYNKVFELGVKLGIRSHPTEEELKKCKEFIESPEGIKLIEMLNTTNQCLADIDDKYKLDVLYGIKSFKD